MTAVVIVVIVIVAAILIYGRSIDVPDLQRLHEETLTIKARRDAQIICQQCQTRGRVTTCQVTLKKGVSGGKATGALLTGGLSLLATGLSRKEDATKAECANCGSVWHF
jgi:hypothetical protein